MGFALWWFTYFDLLLWFVVIVGCLSDWFFVGVLVDLARLVCLIGCLLLIIHLLRDWLLLWLLFRLVGLY